MSVGSRSRTGCLTCRIRKKKCDEQQPACQTCQSIELTCYGYNVPLPSWCTSKGSWEEVKDSAEAKALRNLAATRYKIRRKFGLKKGDSVLPTAQFGAAEGDDVDEHRLSRAISRSTENSTSTVAIACLRTVTTPNIWQLYPESMWWDSAINNLVPASSYSDRQNTRLLTMFLEVIHPITHGFYQLPSGKDRSWLLARLVSDEALYNISLSVSACFDHSLTEPLKTDSIGICLRVRSLQNRAIAQLHPRIHKFVTEENQPLETLICTGLSLLDIILNLINLEIFSMLQGLWETHYHAARLLVNDIEIRSLAKAGSCPRPKSSAIGSVLSTSLADDQQKRSMEFCLMNFIWVDVIAISTFGVATYSPSAFDYLYLLENGTIETHRAMGCRGWIMATIVEIARLEPWKPLQCSQANADVPMKDLMQQGIQLENKLKSGLERLEKESCQFQRSAGSHLEEDSRLVSIIWAYAAQIFLQVTVLEIIGTQSGITDVLIESCLQKLEQLPARLVIRVCWPYTIAGCMSTSEQHGRFRRIVSRTMQESEPPGMSWKGLMVMEECWRLQQMHGSSRIGWRAAMDSLDARVLLI